MRYSVYKALNEISSSLVEATTYLKEHSDAINMVVDCAEVVLAIKSTLENNKVNVIEEIHSFLNKVNEIAECIENKVEYLDKLEKLYDLAVIINNYCKSEVRYKFKIVFFAELGAKWDSMDSVYRAYKNREDCEVLVVIAPIFRAIKLPNGEIRSDVIYTDYLTGMGIEHIPFQKYDIKKDLPDLVFTSQPYESVTPEQFWAENIAPYTRLVYLPYYTSSSMIGEEQIYVQCQMPMHKLAWRVICQSEKVKELYSKYSPVGGKNIIACGLPKWDYVVNMDYDKIDLPKEWEKLKGKKVILRNFHYNISSFDLLESLIHKFIEESQGTDIGILCRFHPMLETMFNVYYTDFKEKWEVLKMEIDESANVAIDRNISYDCAFKFSNVLLTWQTSLIPQFLLTKKPIVTLFGDKLEESKNIEKSDEIFIKTTKFYGVTNSDNAYERCKEILLKDDSEYEKRMKLIEEYLPNADGKIGERLASQLITEILMEDNIYIKQGENNDRK